MKMRYLGKTSGKTHEIQYMCVYKLWILANMLGRSCRKCNLDGHSSALDARVLNTAFGENCEPRGLLAKVEEWGSGWANHANITCYLGDQPARQDAQRSLGK